MKKTIKIAAVAALALASTSAFATNGSALIGMGAQARGMAGVGVGMSHGAESALINPALITTVKGTEVSFGGTVFMPDVKNSVAGGTSSNSRAKLNLIPEVSLASKISDHFYMGVGMWGTGGMGTDYRGQGAMSSQGGMYTNLQLMQFGVPLAYKFNDSFSVAVTPLVQYGSLNITMNNAGYGTSQDYKWGYNLGAAYHVAGLTLGLAYTSQIDMDYAGVISTATATAHMLGFGNKLSTPATYGVGASYKLGNSTLAFDYKKIKWSDAKGYQDFDWNDQDVYIIGYQYDADTWAARIGYNYAKSPISEQSNGMINMFNLLGFPAIVESHVAIGGSYKLSQTTKLDLAYTYAPEVKDTYTTPYGAMTTKHSQQGISAQLDYTF